VSASPREGRLSIEGKLRELRMTDRAAIAVEVA